MIVFIVFVVWLLAMVFAVGLCRAAARADAATDGSLARDLAPERPSYSAAPPRGLIGSLN